MIFAARWVQRDALSDPRGDTETDPGGDGQTEIRWGVPWHLAAIGSTIILANTMGCIADAQEVKLPGVDAQDEAITACATRANIIEVNYVKVYDSHPGYNVYKGKTVTIDVTIDNPTQDGTTGELGALLRASVGDLKINGRLQTNEATMTATGPSGPEYSGTKYSGSSAPLLAQAKAAVRVKPTTLLVPYWGRLFDGELFATSR